MNHRPVSDEKKGMLYDDECNGYAKVVAPRAKDQALIE